MAKNNSKITKSKKQKSRKKPDRASRTKKAWAELWELLWADSDIELEPDEKIKQCKSPYKKYWFITNHGRLFSIYYKRIEQLKPYPDDKTGPNRDQLVWKYNDGKRNIPVDKIVFDHFGKKQWDGKTELHHVIGMKHWDKEDVFEANKVDNIQALPKKIHTFATTLDNNTDLEMFLKFLKKADGNCIGADMGEMLLNGTFPEGVIFYVPVKDEYGNTGWKVIRDQKVTKAIEIN